MAGQHRMMVGWGTLKITTHWAEVGLPIEIKDRRFSFQPAQTDQKKVIFPALWGLSSVQFCLSEAERLHSLCLFLHPGIQARGLTQGGRWWGVIFLVEITRQGNLLFYSTIMILYPSSLLSCLLVFREWMKTGYFLLTRENPGKQTGRSFKSV